MTVADVPEPGQQPSVPAVEVELRDSVLWMYLARPEVLNAIDLSMLAGLNAAIDRACEPDVRVVVLRGRGRAFCAGADLAQAGGETLDVERLLAMVAEAARVATRLAALPRPTIAAVNGITAAGGLELALACDLLVATRSARIGDAHSNYGLLPGAGGSFRLARVTGARAAKHLMFTGELRPAAELATSGLVSEVVDDDRFDDRLAELTATLARRSPRTLTAMKALVDASLFRTDHEAGAAELEMLSRHAHGPDLVEGIRAFREGRRPQFEDGPRVDVPHGDEGG